MRYSKIEEAFTTHVKKQELTGAVCGVYQGEKQLYGGVFGYRDCQQSMPMVEDNIFRLASMTKPITAVAILLLKERGLLDLNAPVSRYIEDFRLSGVGELHEGRMQFVEKTRGVTILDCLTHSSGLGSGEVGNFQFLHFPEPKILRENVRSWNGAFLDFAPKSRQSYSGVVAFELLAYIVEVVGGMPFDAFLQKEIFTPLDMKDTCYVLSEKQKTRLVEMTKTSQAGGLEYVDFAWRGFHVFAEGYTGGSAGLFSTLADYAKFAGMLANQGKWKNVRILQADSVKKMQTPQLPASMPGIDEYFNWGLGVRVCEKQGNGQPLPCGSFGWSGAYGTHFWIEPDTGRYVVLMLNKADVGGSGSPFSHELENLCR